MLGDVGANALGGVGLGEVDGEVGGAAGQRLGQRPQALLAAGDEDQLGARLAGESLRGRLADPARRAGDQGRSSPVSLHAVERYSKASLRTSVRIDILPP